MLLNEEQLNFIFQEYLEKFVLPGSADHLPIFESKEGGAILTKRLKKILRARELSYLCSSTEYNISEISLLTQDLLRDHPKCYILGLNHWFTIKDVKFITNLIEKYFG